MKYFLITVLFSLLFTFVQAQAQDTIVKTSGEEIFCRILKETPTRVYYKVYSGTVENYYIERSEIQFIRHSGYKPVIIPYSKRVFLGLGMGLDFGGFGGNLMYNPTDALGLYFGAGYAIAGVGVNGGAVLRLVPKDPLKKVVPFITGMYGYNAAIAIQNMEELNKLFYGPSVGLGIEVRSRKMRAGCWTFALLVPFRSDEVQTYMDDLENNHGVDFQNDLMPVQLSIGYHFGL